MLYKQSLPQTLQDCIPLLLVTPSNIHLDTPTTLVSLLHPYNTPVIYGDLACVKQNLPSLPEPDDTPTEQHLHNPDGTLADTSTGRLQSPRKSE